MDIGAAEIEYSTEKFLYVRREDGICELVKSDDYNYVDEILNESLDCQLFARVISTNAQEAFSTVWGGPYIDYDEAEEEMYVVYTCYLAVGVD